MNFGFIKKSVGKIVQLERGGPDKIVGELVGIQDDHLVLRTKEHGVIYCVSDHIKSVTEPIVSRLEPAQSDSETEIPLIPIEDVPTFQELLGSMQGNLVQINHSGPNMIKGVLYSVGPESVTLVYEMKEYIHYPIFHIRSIAQIYEIVQNQDNGKSKDNAKQGEEGNDKKKNGK